MSLKLNIRGDKELARRLASLRVGFPAEFDKALEREAKRVLADAKNNLVPYDTGDLAKSGKVAFERRGSGHYAGVAFGTTPETAGRAIATHEEPPSEHHPPSWRAKLSRGESIQWTTPGTGHKYLAKAIARNADTMVDRVARRIRGFVSSVAGK